MQLSTSDLYLLSQCAISAAFQAGQIIANFERDKLTVNTKQAGSSLASQVVTEVDHLSQAIILQNLLPSCEIYDLALLTEESPDDGSRLEKDYFWCIDPLDGTLPFIEGVSGYSVSIALVSRESVPTIGVIYDPVEQILYHAVRGTGVFRNGKPWQQPQQPLNKSPALTFMSDRSFANHPQYSEVLIELEKIAKTLGYKEIEVIQQAGGAINACWVLEKSPACYFKFPCEHPGGGGLWDFSASACLFNEMNAIASDIYGQTLDLNRADSIFMNHRGVLYSSSDVLAELIVGLYKNLKLS
ncbi:MAG: inositol monophosphatase [Methylococcales bacterium]|nr:inositol monophosphatase [Methylococcales bacterium]